MDSNFFSSHAHSADVFNKYTQKESEILELMAASIRNTSQVTELNVIYFTEDILTIMKQMYSVLIEHHFNESCINLMVVDLPTMPSAEPILLYRVKSGVLHIFNLLFIRKMFNAVPNFEITDLLVKPKRRLAELRPNASFQVNIATDEDIGVKLNDLQMANLVKLFVMCDHAVEHYEIFQNSPDQNDYTHINFNKNPCFLSCLISRVPNKSLDIGLYYKSDKLVKSIFVSSKHVETESSSSDDD
jgi:hypothetical protein